ncbi:MAG: M23 family metallopeptidase [Saprospiraceae bacterium]|nr:M23 family metallopeptidase [Saprospiraceae bacterium]
MAINVHKARKWLQQHLEKRFLFIIRNEETFEETASYRLTLKNIYILASTLVFVLSLFLLLLVIFTPIKKYIPGYGDVRSQREYLELDRQIQALEKTINSRDTYIESIQRILEGKPQTRSDVTKNVQIKQVKPESEPKVKEDSLLRAEFESLLAREIPAKDKSKERKSSPMPRTFGPEVAEVNTPLNLVAPIRGPVGAKYNPETGHLGVDIMAAQNTPIKAMLDGTVIQADWSIENGHTIALQHNNNLVSIYKHNSALLKKQAAA